MKIGEVVDIEFAADDDSIIKGVRLSVRLPATVSLCYLLHFDII